MDYFFLIDFFGFVSGFELQPADEEYISNAVVHICWFLQLY